MANSNNLYASPAPTQDLSPFNQNYMQQPKPNPDDIKDSTTVMNMALALMAKAFKLIYSTPTNNNQRISSNPMNRQIAQPGNGNQNQIGNGNLVAVRAEGNAAGQNGNQIRCYNCKGVDLDEIEEVNANCILMANLQQASTLCTQTDSAPIYDLDGLAEFMGTVRFGNDHVAAIMGFGQFCDSDLEVAFRRNVCFVRNLEGVDLLKGDRLTNIYTINLHEMAFASPIYLMARASSTKSWLWHQRLSHLNFDTINDLAKNDLVLSVPRFKYHKEHLCPLCDQGKSKRASHPPKPVPNSRQRLHLIHMDLCRPMRIASINGKWYILVIVDDYSRYTWVHFLRSKDKAPELIITFLKRITVLLQSTVIIIRTDNGIEFKNQVLKEYFDIVEAARTMLIFSRVPLFLWAEVIATACFTQNCSIIHHRFNKTPYELDIGFYIGYSANSCAYRVYNRQTKKIMETMNVSFDELSAMDFEQRSSKPGLQSMTSGQINSGLDLTYAPSTITKQQPTEGELDLLFEAMYDDYIGCQPSAFVENIQTAHESQVRQTSTASTSLVDTAPTPTNSSSLATNIPITSQDVDELNLNVMVDGNTFVNPFANSSTREHSRLVLIRNQLRSDGDMCMYALTVSTMEPKNVKEAMTDLAWIESMQEELLQFKRMDNNFFKGTIDSTLFIRRFYDDILVPLRNVNDGGNDVFSFGLQVNQHSCGIFINQSKYVLEILNKYGMESCDPVGTPMEIKDKLDLDQNGTLAKPTEKHLKEVKRIFRYLRGIVNTGLWYTKDSGFELTGFSDTDYAGCKDTFKSTSGGAQFLGEKLVSWSRNKTVRCCQPQKQNMSLYPLAMLKFFGCEHS
uniref:Integrase catalytic domain-containing protein n=1 Tax=Tanacetum cinerariifolium TaxID=118510 RepID=A0A6L2KEB2_TANCI|nr:hypothetical protein [Tanacetum cinerariifolium]